MKQKFFTLLIVVLSLVGIGSNVNAATYTATTNGAWALAATWGGGGFPTLATDDVIIPTGITVNTGADATCKSLSVTGTLTCGAFKLYVNGDITVNAGGTVTIGGDTYCSNLTISNTGTFNSTTAGTSVKGLYIGYVGSTESAGTYVIQNNGTFGGTTYQGTGSGIRIFFSSKASSLTIDGSTGVCNIGTILPTKTQATTNFNLNIKQSLSLGMTTAAFSLQDNGITYGYTRTCTIDPGVIVTCGAKFHNNGSTAPVANQGNFVYNVYGTLDLATKNAEFDFYTHSKPASTTTTSGSTAATLGASSGDIKVGMSIEGTGIASGTTVAAISATAVTLSQAATASGTNILVYHSVHNLTLNLGNGTDAAELKLGQNIRLAKNSLQNIYMNVSNANSLVTFGSSGAFSLVYTNFGTSTPTLFPSSFNNFTISNSGGLTLPNSTVNISGNFTPTYSLTNNVVLNGSSTQTVTPGATATINGSLTVNSGATATTSTNTLTVAGDVTVNGTLTLGSAMSAYNVSVGNGATFTANIGSNSGSRRTLTVGSGVADNDATVTVNGILGGTKWSTDGIDIEVSANAKTFTLSGTGTIAISGIRPAVNADSRALDIYLNRSLYLSRDNGGAANIEPALTIQNGTCTFNRTLTVSNGVTLTFQGNAGLHGKRNDPNSSDELLYNYASSSLNQGNCTYNINGIMDLRSYSTGAICNLNTTSFAGNTQSVTLNVGSTGVLKLGRVIKMYTALTGQSVSIVPATGSIVEYGGTTAATILLTTGTGIAPTLPAAYSNLTISNTNGITLPTDFSVSGTMAIDQSLTGGTITLLPLANSTIAASKILTANTLNLNSNSSGTATLLNNGTATITTANIQQYLPDARNWYVSSPVSNALAPAGYTYYRYNEGASNWTASPVLVGDQLSKGIGYIALPGASASTLTFTTQAGGTINAGDVDVTLTRSGSTKTGFNLIGNPYPCHLGWTYDFINANSAKIEPTIWIRTNAGTTNNSGQWSFVTYSAESAESVPSVANAGVIAPMQAFWIRAKAAGTLTLSSSLTKSHQSSNPMKAPAAMNTDRKRLRLELSNGTTKDETLIFFDANALDSYDKYDSPKMFVNSSSTPEIYTRAGTEELVINGMNQYSNGTLIPLGFKSGETNTFKLSATQVQNFDADAKIILVDNVTSTQTDLTAGETYTFTSDATSTTNRFSVIFKSASGSTELERNFSGMNIFASNGEIIIDCKNIISQGAGIQVYNNLGQLIYNERITKQLTRINRNFAQGTYIVKVKNGNQSKTDKIVF